MAAVQTMLAAVYDRAGTVEESLSVREVSRPDPGPGEVRVRIRVAGVNPTDWKSIATGALLEGRDLQIPGQDGAGVIDAVGEGVDDGRVGERVWILMAAQSSRHGTAAQWTVVPEHHAIAMADRTSFDLGASMGVPAMTAHHCLFADGGIDGATVLIAGGAGAVGHYAIELAKRAGARTIATVSNEDKARLASGAGADLVVNYRSDDAAAQIREFAGGGVDRVIELALGPNLALDLEVLGDQGVICTYADTGDPPTLAIRRLMTANVTLRFVLLYGVPAPALARAASEISEALGEGALSELPAHRFSLADARDAYVAVREGAVGKVLVEPA